MSTNDEDRCFGYVRYATIPACAVDDTRVSDGMLRVLVTMGSYATQRNGRHVWAKQSTIAERLGISRQAIHEHVSALAQIGYVHVQKTTRSDGGQGTNRIRMVLDMTVPDEYLRELHPHPRKGIGGRKRKSADAPTFPLEDPAEECAQTDVTPAPRYDGASADDARDGSDTPVNSELRPPVNSELTAPKLNGVAGVSTQWSCRGVNSELLPPKLNGVAGGPRGLAAASADGEPGEGMSEGADFAAHPDLLSGSSNRIFQQERATVRARSSPPAAVKTAFAEAPPAQSVATSSAPADGSALTTIGGREQYRAWHDVIDAINVSTAIKDNWLRPCKLYSFDRDSDHALLLVHANFAVEPVGRFHSTLESLVAQKLKRRGLRLVIRSVQQVRADEEALI